MGGLKSRKKRPETAAEMEKMINEMKKKVQLSEGQRKALFEECETEQKNNTEKIETLKKEVSQLIVTLRNKTSNSVKDRIRIPQLNSVAAYLGEKMCNEVIVVLDLQVIDKVKKLDLIRYKIAEKERCLKEMAKQYQQLQSQQVKKSFAKKIKAPVTRTTFSIENQIHAVQVQWREANHIKTRYIDIKRSLLNETASYHAIIKNTEQELKIQESEIEKLQKIGAEAAKKKAFVRTELLHEEKSAVLSAMERERLESQGRRLVAEGRQELEKLEQLIFMSGKTQERQDEENPEEGQLDEDQLLSPNPEQDLIDTFDKLKETAGAKDAEETLEKFQIQRTTLSRLENLKATSEKQKSKLERRIQQLTNQLEAFKFAEVKEAEQNIEDIEKMRTQIDEQNSRKHIKMEQLHKTKEIIKRISDNLRGMYLNVNPKSTGHNIMHTQEMIVYIRTTLMPMLDEEGTIEIENIENEEIEEKWFPPSYNSLLRRTPVPQTGTISISQTAGSEEEEEVPTRDHLKKQAQMVVEAKSRKKVMRFAQRK
ncbi:uncharacterized abhydrolase domain-containing protein DDB_G0269086-like [Agrilus planipennis]|uniref:Uncharacterized abhydrolase domain-containing protein DDB_G0269086-like n=1 Tax=Agrilus planipennis TaxID=224129 RepID=A0A1W4X6S5_AGRPL|nr:uncharacterized abhydrolase domain-containing protein DDB_G0269086-like [Agrilus planipennis]